MAYEKLLAEAEHYNLCVREKPLKANKGRIKGKRIATKKDISTVKEKACVLAEELGHYHTTVGNIVNLEVVNNRKQELRAREWAYNRMIGLIGITRAYEAGCRDKFEIAEFLQVTEIFLIDAIECYRRKYGMCATIDNYIVYFEPHFGVAKMI